MTVLKSFLALIGVFFLAIIFMGFFLPRKDQVVVSRTMSCSPDKAYAQVNDLKNWEKWSAWHQMDPQMQIQYSDTTAGKGAWYSWRGNSKVSYGKLQITDHIENQKIDLQLNYEDKGDSHCAIKFTPVPEGTRVDWSMDMNYSNNPWMKRTLGGYQYIIMNYFLSKDFGTGLDNLNLLCGH